MKSAFIRNSSNGSVEKGKELFGSETVQNSWDESAHPRADDGKFGSGGGKGGSKKPEGGAGKGAGVSPGEDPDPEYTEKAKKRAAVVVGETRSGK